MVDIDPNTRIEEPKIKIASFDEAKKLVEKVLSESEYKANMIRAILEKKSQLRKTYLSIIKINPARIGEIGEHTFNTRKTIYNHLYNLMSLGLVEKIPIMQLYEKKSKKTPQEKQILKKFKDWTSKMNDGMKRYFTAKTCYWVLTESGRDLRTIERAIKNEMAMKGEE